MLRLLTTANGHEAAFAVAQIISRLEADIAGHSLPLPGVLHDARAMAQMILEPL